MDPAICKSSLVRQVHFSFLNGVDIEGLALTDQEIIDAVEVGLRAQGHGETVIEARVHLEPDPTFDGHFNVLRGYVAPLDLAGVKIVGDYVGNYRLDLPSEMALLNLFDPRTGMPRAVMDATAITEMRTGAVTAIGARLLARPDAKVLGHVGARGTAYWNVRLIDSLFDLDEIRVHSRRPDSREAFAARLRSELSTPVVVTDTWESCARGADIVVDDWGQCRTGRFGSLRAHVDTGRLSEENLHAELAQIVVGDRPGRENDDETVLFWHRGMSLSDIALGAAILKRATEEQRGTTLRLI